MRSPSVRFILAILASLFTVPAAQAQYPSPTYSSLSVLGTLGVVGPATFSSATTTGLLQATDGATVSGGTLTAGATSLGATQTTTLGTGTLTVTGATTTSSLGVTNGATVGTTLGVGTNETVGGTLGVTGSTTLSSATITGTLGVGTNETVGGTLGVTGSTTIGGTLGVVGPATFGGGLSGALTGTATAANGLNSATTSVVTSGATAPSAGQVLTAMSGTAAGWAAPIPADCVQFTSSAIGGNGNGSANNASAWAAALAALPSGGGCIYFPAGNYYSATAVSFTYPSTANYSLTLVGAGSDSSILYWNGTSGVTISALLATQSIHIKDLTFATGAAGTYTGLTVNNAALLGNYAQSDITRTTFRGNNGGALTNYWATGLSVVGMSNINYVGDLFYGNNSGTGGIGLSISGNGGTSPYYSVVHNISGCGFYNLGIGLNYGTYVQGVTVSQSNFVNGQTGIYAGAGETGLTELSIVGGNNFNSLSDVMILSPLAGLIVTGNLFYVQGSEIGIYLNATGNLATITGNVFTGLSATGSFGISVASNFSYGVVMANVFNTLDVGVSLPGTSTWNVQANKYNNVSTAVGSPGANSVGVATN
jgi:hypothetical protein